MAYKIIPLEEKNVEEVLKLYNDIIKEGVYFQRKTPFTREGFVDYIGTHHVYTLMDEDEVAGIFILRPNGGERIAHIANGTYGLKKDYRGKNLGRYLVSTSLEKAKEKGFLGIQYNSVVVTNVGARHLYESLGFQEMARIPKGFRTDDGFLDMSIYFKSLQGQ